MTTVICRRLLRRSLFVQPAKYLSSSTPRQPVSGCYEYVKRPRLNELCGCSRIPLLNFRGVVYYSTEPKDGAPKKESLLQRFKTMYKQYWYVLVPVHLVTSTIWFGSFYYLAKSGFDVPALLESWNFSEGLIRPLRDSSVGYVAIAYALYKIATPLRYTVTLGGTTLSINYLKKLGYIKPVPNREQLKRIYEEKKESLMYSVKDKTDELKLKRDKLKDQTGDILTKINKSKQSAKEDLLTKINKQRETMCSNHLKK